MLNLRARRDEKLQTALKRHLMLGEELRGYTVGTEHLNFWLHFLLLGPVAGAVLMRSYNMGLTERRVILSSLSWWTSKPTGKASGILLGRITDLEYKKGILSGSLKIRYGEGIERKFTIARPYSQNTQRLVDSFELLPKPKLNEEEMRMALEDEKAHRQDAKDRLKKAFIILGIIICILVFLALGGSY